MPPFVGVAVNVTLVPVQIALPGLGEILTDGVSVGFTTIIIPLEVAAAGLAHASDDVMTTVTISPFANDAF